MKDSSAMAIERGGGLDLEVQYVTDMEPLPGEADVRQWAAAALADDRRHRELLVRIVDEDETRMLNSRYRGKDRPTNVLSFPCEPPPGVQSDHLGDLVICAPVVVREARMQGKPVEHHWAHMVIHGVLHLRGYDHIDDAEAEVMESLERDILRKLGIPDPYVTQEGAVQ